MTRHLCTLLAATAVSALALAACAPKTAAPAAPAGADTAAITDALKAQATQYATDFNAKDLDKVMAYYAADAIVMQPDQPVANGADAVKKGLQAGLADPAAHLALTTDAVGVSSAGDMAYVVGHSEGAATNPKTHAVDHLTQGYVVTEKKDASGAWKVEAVAVTNHPAPAAAPSAAATPATK